MHTLMDLPNEILKLIIDAIGPEDIESFSTCCKLLYSLARHRLEEHKTKKSLFSKLLVEDYFLPFPEPLRGEKYGKPDTYLKEFFSDERNRLYPKDMAVGLTPDGVGLMDKYGGSRTAAINGLDNFEHQLESRMAEVHSMIALEVSEIEAEDWGKHVKLGYPVATFLFLLALLPNLEQFSIDVFGYGPTELSANYSKSMRLMIEAALRQKENGLTFGGRLSECTVNGYLCGGIGESLLPFLMMLPKMQKIQGYCLDMEAGSWPYPDAVSPVVDLHLQGAIDSVTLSNYIRGIRELKRFWFAFTGHENIDWEPCRIVATLRQFAFRSLVFLDLTTYVSHEMIWSDISPGIGSLRSFEVLETVRLHSILLFEEVQTAETADIVYSRQTLEELLDKSLVKGRNLIDFLPSSVRTFKLEAVAKGGFILDAFEGFLEHRLERLPKLGFIFLDAGDETISQIEKICKEAGVWMISHNKYPF